MARRLRNLNAPSGVWAGILGTPYVGTLAELIPSTGEYGPGYAYDSLELPADNGKEIRGLITTWPTLGTLTAFEDTSFEYDGASDTFAFQLYVDGVAVGTPQTVTITIGGATVSPTTGSAFASGYAPTVAQGSALVLSPAAGRAEVTGYAPAVTAPNALAPSAGQALATGHAPALSQPATLSPASGRAGATGYAPVLALPRTASPTAGQALATGHTPTITQGAAGVSPAAGHALTTGYAPTVTHPQGVSPTAGRLDLSGYAPIVVQGVTVSPTTGRVELSSYAPTLAQGGALTLSPAAGRAEYHGHAPAVSTVEARVIPLGPRRGLSLSSGRALPLRW